MSFKLNKTRVQNALHDAASKLWRTLGVGGLPVGAAAGRGRGDGVRAAAGEGPRQPGGIQRRGAARQRRVHITGPGGGGDAQRAPLHAAAAPLPGQGLTLFHFSAQPEPFLTLNTFRKRLNNPSTPALNTP
jgi:hypothetical protein